MLILLLASSSASAVVCTHICRLSERVCGRIESCWSLQPICDFQSSFHHCSSELCMSALFCCSPLLRLETEARPPDRGVVPSLGPVPALMDLILPLQPTQLFISHTPPQTIDFGPFLLMSLTRSPIGGDRKGRRPPPTLPL